MSGVRPRNAVIKNFVAAIGMRNREISAASWEKEKNEEIWFVAHMYSHSKCEENNQNKISKPQGVTSIGSCTISV